MAHSAVIEINIDPTIRLGPLSLTWHGLGIAAGILCGSVLASGYAKRRGLDQERVLTAVWLITLSGIAGAKLFFLLVNTPEDLLRPSAWFSGQGFAFYGALIFGTLAVGLYLSRTELDLRYLDALAYGFPLGMAVGRIGDVINGEHYGPPSDAPWAFRYLHPGADVPSHAVAYHSGGFYEMVLALAMLPIVVALARRLGRPGMLLWSVIGLYGAGRFLMFFYRSDSDPLALGLNGSQWTSVALIAAAGIAAWLTARPASARWWRGSVGSP